MPGPDYSTQEGHRRLVEGQTGQESNISGELKDILRADYSELQDLIHFFLIRSGYSERRSLSRINLKEMSGDLIRSVKEIVVENIFRGLGQQESHSVEFVFGDRLVTFLELFLRARAGEDLSDEDSQELVYAHETVRSYLPRMIDWQRHLEEAESFLEQPYTEQQATEAISIFEKLLNELNQSSKTYKQILLLSDQPTVAQTNTLALNHSANIEAIQKFDVNFEFVKLAHLEEINKLLNTLLTEPLFNDPIISSNPHLQNYISKFREFVEVLILAKEPMATQNMADKLPRLNANQLLRFMEAKNAFDNSHARLLAMQDLVEGF